MKYQTEKQSMRLCEVCEQTFSTEQRACPHCGWVNGNAGIRYDPDEIYFENNFVTRNKARALYRAGKPIQPDFDDFLQCMKVYGELEFYLHGKRYGVLQYGKIYFYQWDVEESEQTFSTIEAFGANANVDGIPLRDLWQDVTDVGLAK